MRSRRRLRPRDWKRGKGIAGSRPSGRSLSGNAIVARVAQLGAGAPLSFGGEKSAWAAADASYPLIPLVAPDRMSRTKASVRRRPGPLLLASARERRASSSRICKAEAEASLQAP